MDRLRAGRSRRERNGSWTPRPAPAGWQIRSREHARCGAARPRGRRARRPRRAHRRWHARYRIPLRAERVRALPLSAAPGACADGQQRAQPPSPLAPHSRKRPRVRATPARKGDRKRSARPPAGRGERRRVRRLRAPGRRRPRRRAFAALSLAAQAAPSRRERWADAVLTRPRRAQAPTCPRTGNPRRRRSESASRERRWRAPLPARNPRPTPRRPFAAGRAPPRWLQEPAPWPPSRGRSATRAVARTRRRHSPPGADAQGSFLRPGRAPRRHRPQRARAARRGANLAPLRARRAIPRRERREADRRARRPPRRGARCARRPQRRARRERGHRSSRPTSPSRRRRRVRKTPARTRPARRALDRSPGSLPRSASAAG